MCPLAPSRCGQCGRPSLSRPRAASPLMDFADDAMRGQLRGRLPLRAVLGLTLAGGALPLHPQTGLYGRAAAVRGGPYPQECPGAVFDCRVALVMVALHG